MTDKTTMRPYTAPGLPPRPKLWFDREQKQAKVTLRLATWKSWLCAFYASRILRWLLNFTLGWKLWHELDFIENPFGRGFWILIVVGMFSSAVKPFLHATLDGFLARQLFAVRTTFWFNPKAIAFRSRLYANGVVIWRVWEQEPVKIRFDVEQDPEASEYEVRQDFALKTFSYRQKSAFTLRLIVETNDESYATTSSHHPSSMRAIPALELDSKDAANITMVLMTATVLTQHLPDKQTANHPGFDIDIATP